MGFSAVHQLSQVNSSVVNSDDFSDNFVELRVTFLLFVVKHVNAAPNALVSW